MELVKLSEYLRQLRLSQPRVTSAEAKEQTERIRRAARNSALRLKKALTNG